MNFVCPKLTFQKQMICKLLQLWQNWMHGCWACWILQKRIWSKLMFFSNYFFLWNVTLEASVWKGKLTVIGCLFFEKDMIHRNCTLYKFLQENMKDVMKLDLCVSFSHDYCVDPNYIVFLDRKESQNWWILTEIGS